MLYIKMNRILYIYAIPRAVYGFSGTIIHVMRNLLEVCSSGHAKEVLIILLTVEVAFLLRTHSRNGKDPWDIWIGNSLHTSTEVLNRKLTIIEGRSNLPCAQ